MSWKKASIDRNRGVGAIPRQYSCRLGHIFAALNSFNLSVGINGFERQLVQ